MFILCFGSNRNAFYLYTVTSAACSNIPYYAHGWLYKGCGYCTDLSVPCNMAQFKGLEKKGNLLVDDSACVHGVTFRV